VVATINPVAQAELAKQYRNARARFWGFMTAVERIAIEDYPGDDAPQETITRYDLDSILGLTSQLSALVEGHQRAH
jgi:hypothetical protein